MQLSQQPVTKEQKKKFASGWINMRDRARRDLFFLANEVLSPADSRIMTHHAHDSIVNHCQKFYGREEIVDFTRLSKLGMPLIVQNKPRVLMPDLPGFRDDMLLVSRGHLKTTIQTVAHSIQWIINYPDVRILICTSTEEKARIIVGKIKQHFQFNPHFRFLFPEFCPKADKVGDWGSSTELIVPNRNKRGDEPTIMTATVGKALASTHHDVIKCSDVVTENNVRTTGQIQEVKDFFGYLEPLRERFLSRDGRPNPGWKSVEGTIYAWSDYHNLVMDSEASRPEAERTWKITRKSCWTDKAKTKSLWPEHFPPAELHRIQNSPEVGPVLFAAQYELDPVRAEDGLAAPEEIKFFPAHLIGELMPRYTLYTRVDLADPNPDSVGDFTVFTTAGIDRDGRIDVLSVQRGHFDDEQIVNMFFNTDKVFGGRTRFGVQKDHFARMLAPLMKREMAKRQHWLNIEFTTISTRISKVQKIRGLQGFFRMGLIRFADNIPCRNEIINEIVRFPKGNHDDILDTLSDLLTNAKGAANTDLQPDAPKWAFGMPRVEDAFIEFDPLTKEAKWLLDMAGTSQNNTYHEMTGV